LRQPKITASRINSRFLNNHKDLTILGLSYKPGSFVTEESQAIMLAKELSRNWNNVYVHDPLIECEGLFSGLENISQLDSISKIKNTDLVIVAVNWSEYQYIIKNHPKENLYLV